jgi:hypothetical protein
MLRRFLLLPTLLLLAPAVAGAEAQVGKVAPWFDLAVLSGGRVSRHSLAGKVAVLVVGRTQPSAPPCKAWTMTLLRRPVPAAVYQVIVADKPWYAPRSAVLNKVRSFVGPEHNDRILLEWYRAFAEAFGIPRDDDPRIFVLDQQSRIRLLVRGALTSQRLEKVNRTVQSLSRQAAAGVSAPCRTSLACRTDRATLPPGSTASRRWP